MGSFTNQKVKTYDPTNPATVPVRDQANAFLMQMLANPGGFATMNQNGNAVNAGNQMANMQGNPEADVYKQLAPFLMNLASSGGGNPQELQFNNQFGELQNPFGDLGAVNQAQQTLTSALPLFDRNLQRAQGSLMNAAPNRFSSRMAQEGTDLASQALNDYNLFANQALMQGQQLQSQERQNALNFMTSARGLQQQAAQNTAQNQLGARGLYQQGQQSQAQNQLGAANAMTNAASNAGNGLFNRVMQSGQFGLAQQQANMNPTLQLLLSAFGWGQPQSTTPIVQPSLFQTLAGGAQTAAGIYNLTKGNNNQQPGTFNGGQYGWPNGNGSYPNWRG